RSAGASGREPGGECGCHGRTDPLDLLEPSRVVGRDALEVGRGMPEPVGARRVVACRDLGRQPDRELDRRRPADLRDPEPREDPFKRAASRLLDGGVEVLCALAAEPLEALEILDREPVEITAPLDEPGLEKLLEGLPAGALDVHPAAPDEMLELLGDTCRTGGVRAVMGDRALVPHYRCDDVCAMLRPRRW